MHEFFKGWRPKAGCVTLVVGFVFFAGSLRSREYSDVLLLRRATAAQENVIWEGTFEEFRSVDGSFFWNTHCQVSRGDFFWKAPFLSVIPTSQYWNSRYLYRASEIEWFFGDWALGAGIVRKRNTIIRTFPYWMILTPLTLLSAYLLLSKPRPAAPKQTTEPAPSEAP